MLAWYAVAVLGLSGQVRFFCQDETRLGLKTISGRKITVKGIKPKGKVQWQFKYHLSVWGGGTEHGRALLL
ncbi:MAG: hypothetical protein RBJ76_06450 [Stenomitos frigidus ULC029]